MSQQNASTGRRWFSFPKIPFRYPAARVCPGNVGTPGLIGPNPTAPLWSGYRPVIITVRDGWQTATVTKAFVNRIPSAANRSMFGVMPGMSQPVTPSES